MEEGPEPSEAEAHALIPGGGGAQRRRCGRPAALAAGAAGALALLGLWARGGVASAVAGEESLAGGSARVGATLQTVNPGAVVSMFDPLSVQASGIPGMPAGQDDDTSYYFTVPKEIQPDFRPRPPKPTSQLPPELEGVELGPAACAANEELNLGLCYMKCSLLTNGTRPHRLSAYQCCAGTSGLGCLLKENGTLQFSFVGRGVDVDGRGTVPHPPGQCLSDEENFLNQCYKKCTLLTNHEYPIRSGSATCCKQQPCYNLFHLQTSGGDCAGYNVGGGSTNLTKCPHEPFNVKQPGQP